jgi:hypothetical protein
VGRPRTRRADVVQRDALQLLGVRGWRRRAENRDDLRHALREAKARKGCSAIHGMEWKDRTAYILKNKQASALAALALRTI